MKYIVEVEIEADSAEEAAKRAGWALYNEVTLTDWAIVRTLVKEGL